METMQIYEVGKIKEIKKSVAKIRGLTNCMNGQILDLTPRTKGMILGFVEDEVHVLLLGKAEEVKVGDQAYNKMQSFDIPVGREYIGRVVNALAEPIDGKGPMSEKLKRYPMFREAPGVLERVPLTETFETGTLIIDSTIPIGKGQRELVIGDRMTGKTSICLEAILNQKGKNVICIYCCIGKSFSSLERVVRVLKNHGALDYTIVVSASAATSVGEQYLVPYTACTLGEYFMDHGEDVFVVFDDLSKHAWAYRQISLLLERPPGRDAYPGDVFYLHSQLMERAGQLNPERGSGSMTFLPIVDTIQGDLTGYIQSNLISMTDGQIFLNAGLFNAGFKPAVDLGLSVSRIGNKVQSPIMKELSTSLRLESLQYHETLKLTRFKSGVSDEVRKRLRRGEILTRLFIQGKNRPYSLEEQVFYLYALKRNILDLLNDEQIDLFKKNIASFAKEHDPELIKNLRGKHTFTPDIDKKLETCLREFLMEHIAINKL
jgi:F-type H+/Na+-transporting ATPase subunit alpha